MSENLEKLTAEFAKAKDEVSDLGEKLQGRMEKGEKNLESLKEQVDEALIKMNEIFPRLGELEQKSARPQADQPPSMKSLAQELLSSPELAALTESTMHGKSATAKIKATITSLRTDAAGSAGALVVPDYQHGVLGMPNRQLAIRDLLAPGSTSGNTISYVRETGFANNAAARAEGEAFNYSDLKFEDKSLPVRSLGHLAKASKEILSDASQLESFINQRLAYGLKEVEDRQLLNGDGTGLNLHGILPQASEFVDPAKLATYSIIDLLRLAALQAAITGYPATGIVMNPVDWTKIELQKDNNGRHIIGNPQGLAQPSLWRMPVVETVAMASGRFLTGAFRLGAQIFDREEIGVEVSTENQDDFERNLVTFKCYERLALAVYRPEAFIKGNLAAKIA